jgi:hypothetical protein
MADAAVSVLVIIGLIIPRPQAHTKSHSRICRAFLISQSKWTGIAPVTAAEPSILELAFLAKHNARGRRMSPF